METCVTFFMIEKSLPCVVRKNMGQLNSIAPVQDSFFTNQQAMPGLGQMDFRPPPNFAYNLQDEHLRSAQLPGSSSRQL
ncbi:hypothetical protein DY000_02060704 [Brassica cretica]|uniref:Uncharacterized protein n=1 Tax=Brassica cretica TaxID=69181 RepID=A0ABQ7ATR3_BRACR|nr:hypothetical protein DY000_02060704 [Brassica cretica]